MKLITTPVQGFSGKVGEVVFTDGRAKVADDARELAYFTAQGYGVADFDEATEAIRAGDDPQLAEKLDDLNQQGGTHEADPQVVEEWKWGTPVWSHDGILCTGESYKSHVKLTFLKGASVPDPKKLFNASLDGNVRRAIDIHEGEKVDARAFKALIRAAAELNASAAKGKSKPAK